jgi:hypothetical protein
MHAKLKKTHFADVECLEIHSRPPKQTPRVVDGGMSVDFSLRDSYWVFSAGSSMLATDQLLDIAHTSIRYLKPPYGIGYQRDQKHGPVFYALGINFSYGPTDEFSGPEYDAAVRVSHWTDAMDERVYMQGILRDIYPYNFLTEPQLTRNVGVKPLNDWISTDSSRGELSHFEGDVWLWSVPDEQIPTLRDELRQHGMIFGLKPDR